MTTTTTTQTQKMPERASYTMEAAWLSEQTLKHASPGIIETGVDPARVRDAVIKSYGLDYDLGKEYGIELTKDSILFYYAVSGRLDRQLDVISPGAFIPDIDRAQYKAINFLENHTRTLGRCSEVKVDNYGPLASGLVIGSADFKETIFLQVNERVHQTASFGFLSGADDFDMVEPSEMRRLYGEWWAEPGMEEKMEKAGALVKHYRSLETYEVSIVSTAPAQPLTFVVGTKAMEGEKVDGLELRQQLASKAIRTPVSVADLAVQVKGLDYGTIEPDEVAELKHLSETLKAGLITAEGARSLAWIAATAAHVKAGLVA